ncbi:putative membrane protein [Helicobacter pylori Hp H-27]|nr:putative membrane protein [Helicobacter pylori Hp H-27]
MTINLLIAYYSIIALNGFICIFNNISIISYVFVGYWWLFAEFNAR